MNAESDDIEAPKFPSTSRSLPIALIRAREKVMGPIREMLSKSGLTEQQWRILRVLDEHGPLDATKLSESACLLLPSQTRIVQTLVEKGLVTRQTDPTDRRRQTVDITGAGRRIILDNIEESSRLANHIEDVLGRETVDQLLNILGRFERL